MFINLWFRGCGPVTAARTANRCRCSARWARAIEAATTSAAAPSRSVAASITRSVAPRSAKVIVVERWPQLGGQGKGPIHKTSQDGHGVKASDRDALDDLGHHGSDLDAQQGA